MSKKDSAIEAVAEATETTATETTETAAPEVIEQKIVCPHCNQEIIIQRPAPQRRGQLAGLDLLEMSDEQLKRELINASSVLYKAQKRGASAETIGKNQARVDAVKAEKAKRESAKAPVAEAAPAETASV